MDLLLWTIFVTGGGGGDGGSGTVLFLSPGFVFFRLSRFSKLGRRGDIKVSIGGIIFYVNLCYFTLLSVSESYMATV